MNEPRPLLIRGGRVVDPSQELDRVADVLLADGKVAAVGQGLSAPEGAEILDASGLLVTPGWVDMRTQLGDPGYSHRETIATGTEAAAAGGFTTVACLPVTNPVNDNSFVTSYLYQKIARESRVNVYVLGAITKGLQGQELAALGAMWEAGVVGISDGDRAVGNAYLMRKAMDYAKRFDLVVISHAEDEALRGQGVMNEGFHSTKFGLRGIPKAAEEIHVSRDILLAELTGARLHLAHLSTAGAVKIVREAKRRGVRVTAEVSPHHLALTDQAVGTYDTNTKVSPPLREESDIEALCEAVADGTVDALACDHAPRAAEEKEVEYDLADFGMVGLETAFPLYYEAVCREKFSLARMVEAMTVRPAGILRIPKGTLAVGADADVTVSDLNHRHTIRKSTFRSKSQNTPFEGREVRGKVCYTVVYGRVVYRSEHLAKVSQ